MLRRLLKRVNLNNHHLPFTLPLALYLAELRDLVDPDLALAAHDLDFPRKVQDLCFILQRQALNLLRLHALQGVLQTDDLDVER